MEIETLPCSMTVVHRPFEPLYISENFSKKTCPLPSLPSSPVPHSRPATSYLHCILESAYLCVYRSRLSSISCCRFHASPTGETRQVFRPRVWPKRVYLSVGKKRRKKIRRASTTGRRIIFKEFFLDFSSNFERKFTGTRVIRVFAGNVFITAIQMNGVINERNIKITGIIYIYIYMTSSKVHFYAH